MNCSAFSLIFLQIFTIFITNSTTGLEASGNLFLSVPCLPDKSIFKNYVCLHCLDPSPNILPSTPATNVSKIQGNSLKKSKSKKINLISQAFLTNQQNEELRGNHQDNFSAFSCSGYSFEIDKYRIKKGANFLSGNAISIVTIERLPFTKLSYGNFSGVLSELLAALQTKYNFTIRILLPYDGNWGSKLDNGTWNGMIGMVVRNEVAMGVATFSVTLDRESAVDFTVAYHQEPTGILIPAPSEGEKLSVLIRPLSSMVWLAVFVTIFILVPTLYVLHIISLRISGESEKKKWWVMTGELFHFIVGSLVQESVIAPVNGSVQTRFLLSIWWLLSFTLANIYVAFLVSYLSVPKLYNSINDLEDLANQHQIQWTFRLNTAHQDLFKSKTSTGVYRAVGLGVSERDLVTTDFAGVQKVLSGKFAFIKEKSFIDVALGQDFEETQICRLTLAKDTFFTVGFAIAVQKQSVLIDLLNYEILSSISTGLMEKWKSMHWPRNLWCADAASYIIKSQPSTRKMNFSDVHGAYFLLGCGVFISLVAFIAERVVYYFQFNHDNQERLFIVQPIYLDKTLKDIKINFVR